MEDITQWINEEFKTLNLRDKRLNDRFIKIMGAMSLTPDGCINRIFRDEAASRKACYRFFDNQNFSAADILKPHVCSTSERMKDHNIVLSLHDTSFFSYNTKDSIEGLGNIGGKYGDKETKGFIGHYALAVTEKGLPLGIQGSRTWSRAYSTGWDKESERWLELVEDVESTYSENTKMVFVADREADQFQILYDVLNRGHSFVIRSKHDRMIQGEDRYLSWHMDKSKKKFDIQIPRANSKELIEASMKFGKVVINDTNQKSNRHLARRGVRTVELSVVEVSEKKVGKDKLRWVLYTDHKLETREDALKIIDYYRMRWQIESFFKVLKGGCCHVEHANLRSFEKLDKYTMCFVIIAWRMFWMQFVHRTDPSQSAKTVLTDIEIAVLKVRHPDKVEVHSLELDLAMRLIAMFGGYNNRANDGPPGMITLWRGFMELRSRAQYHEELLVAGLLK